MNENNEEVSTLAKKEKCDLTSTRRASSSTSPSNNSERQERKDSQNGRQNRTDPKERERKDRQNARQKRLFIRRERKDRQHEGENRIVTGPEETKQQPIFNNGDVLEDNDTLQTLGAEEVRGIDDVDDDSEWSTDNSVEEIEDSEEYIDDSTMYDNELPTAVPVNENEYNHISDRFRIAARRSIIKRILNETNTVVATKVSKDDGKERNEMRQDDGKRQWNYTMIITFSTVVAITAGITLGILLPSNKQGHSINVSTVEPTFSNLAYLEEYLWPISGDTIYDNSSAQYQTLQWLAYEDMQVSMIEDLKLIEIPQLIERYVIALLYFSTNGPTWLHQMNFLSNSSICEWRRITIQETISSREVSSGIHCDNQGVVDGIVLVANNLNGTIPFEIVTLTNLEDISIYGNNLYGTIPSMINSLTRLELLQVQSNFLTGSIPDLLIGLSKLAFFDMKDNQLNGTIPSDITNSKSLKHLDLSFNRLTGTIPEFRVGQNNLVSLFLRSNQLTGTIPVSSFLLPNLEILSLNDNYLTGSIASEIGMMENLVYLQMNLNELTGSIPTSIGRLERLRYLSLGFNLLSGRVPTELGQLTRLDVELLNDNSLTGPIPSEIGQSLRLIIFYIDNNAVTGTLPASFNDILYIIQLSLANTEITGSLDSIVCSDNIRDNKVLTSADCGGSTPKVECTCCAECCDQTTNECEVNLDLIANIFEYKGMQLFGWDVDCTATDMYTYVCTHHNCVSCNEEESICGTQDYNAVEQDIKNDYIYHNEFTYHSEKRNETIIWHEQHMIFCEVWVKGEQCNSCFLHFCRNGYIGRHINCMNVIDGDDGIYDTCQPYQKDGVFEYFSWWDLQSWTGCRPAIYADYAAYRIT